VAIKIACRLSERNKEMRDSLSFEILETKERVIENNDAVAEKVRKLLSEKNVFFINLMSSPGSGKTTTLLRTIDELGKKFRIGVMEADVDSSVDAESVAAKGAKVIQLHTGGSCHMDADMTLRGIEKMGVDDVDILFLENVGNLVCPAEFDVGADKRVVILSVPEGDDKPLKYPLMFTVSDLCLINKIDTMKVFDFDIEKFKQNVKALNDNEKIIPISALTSEGFSDWIKWLDNAAESKIK
jgi:hydrogenase nickel incorporation protein HypB